MKILAIDYGEKWIGLAISDEKHEWAFPHKVLENDRNLFKNLAEIAKNENIYKIVIGLPLNKNMKPTEQTRAVENWAQKLIQAVEVPIDFENEIFTTKMAQRTGGKEHARAAALILESYLKRQKNLIK